MFNKRIKCICLFLALVSSGAAANDDPVRVAIDPESVFTLVWQALIQDMQLEAELVPLSPQVRREAFINGSVALDCCFVEAWRQRPEEREIQHFSAPLTMATDNLVTRRDLVFDTFRPEDLKNWRVAVVDGFTYTHAHWFEDTVPAATVEEAFQLIATGKADLTIIGQREYRKHQSIVQRPLRLGPVTEQLLMKARVRSSHAHLLPALNASITRLKQDGVIEQLIGKALRSGTAR